MDFEIRKDLTSNWFKTLQDSICHSISELEKNESLDKKLLRYLTVKVKKFDLVSNYFGKKDNSDRKEIVKN